MHNNMAPSHLNAKYSCKTELSPCDARLEIQQPQTQGSDDPTVSVILGKDPRFLVGDQVDRLWLVGEDVAGISTQGVQGDGSL